jgi:hypothetical protein
MSRLGWSQDGTLTARAKFFKRSASSRTTRATENACPPKDFFVDSLSVTR